MGTDTPIKEGAVTFASEPVAGWGVVEAGDYISELADTFRAGFDQTRITANLVKPALNHRIIAGDHKSIVKP